MQVLSLAPPDRLEIPATRFAVSTVAALRVALVLFLTGNLGRIPVLDLGQRSAPLLVNDIALLAVLFVGAVAMVQARSLKLNDVAVAGVVFASIGFLSAVAGLQRFGFSALELIASLAYLARWSAYFALYVVVINCVRARDAESVWTTLEWVMIALAVFGLIQAVFLPNFAFIVYPEAQESFDWDSQGHRLVSTILEPNIVSGTLLTILLVQLGRLAAGARVAMWKPLLMFAALVATLSRGGLLSFFVGATILFAWFGLRKRVLKFGAVVTVGVLAALPLLLDLAMRFRRFSVTDESAMGRVIVWQRALSTLVDYPWFGIGFNTYGFVQERRGFARIAGSSYSAEGGLLFIAVMVGLVGLMVYLAMLWFVLRRTRRAARSPAVTPGERGLLIGTSAATIAILVHSAFVNSLLTPWVMEPLLVLWGLSFVIASDLRRRAVSPAVA